MDINRRSLISSALAVTACTLVSVTGVMANTRVSETDKLCERLRNNEFIRDETFHLDKPLVIDFETRSEMTGCSFISKFNDHCPVISIIGDDTNPRFYNTHLVINDGNTYGFYVKTDSPYDFGSFYIENKSHQYQTAATVHGGFDISQFG